MDNFVMPFLGHTITLTQHQEEQEQQLQQPIASKGTTWDLQLLSMTKSSNNSSAGGGNGSSSSVLDTASGTGMKVSWVGVSVCILKGRKDF